MITFGIVGGGWRTGAYLQVARECPRTFTVAGMVVRDADKGALLEAKWGVATFRELDGLLSKRPDFIVLSVPWAVTPGLILELAGKGLAVLAETPPAPDQAGLEQLLGALPPGAKVQVAEQYPFQPYLATCIAISASGKIGGISQAQVSVAHGYHGVAVMRKLLGIMAAPVTISGMTFESMRVEGPGRGGPPAKEEVKKSSQLIASLDWGGKLGVFDFTGDQYFSWIRSHRLLVRGDRGEISGDTVRSLADFRTPVRETLTRDQAGENSNLEGFHLKA
ncbi:MAG: Gfo/Idh/MocA family oxidoreductase, partial [Spirochaetes bacterium]|nr:Gfo/Idh/MocA family oxidoreductase [Spirochaetota bacterium]